MQSVSMHPRFRLLWRRLGLDPQIERKAFHEIVLRYNEPHRAYHTLQHVRNSLSEFERFGRVLALEPDLVRFAIWLHDAVHDPAVRTSEQQSAELASRILKMGGGAEREREVRGLILITSHSEVPQTIDEEIISDVDLAIFGQPPAVFDEYERNIWAEYRPVVSETFFRRKRAEFLQRFLNAPSIYWTRPFRRRYQQAAERNLKRSIDKLKRPRA